MFTWRLLRLLYRNCQSSSVGLRCHDDPVEMVATGILAAAVPNQPYMDGDPRHKKEATPTPPDGCDRPEKPDTDADAEESQRA
jgi:hypothetical protein